MQKFYLVFKKYFYLVLLVLVIFIPLYPKFPLLPVGGTFVAVRLEDLLILGLLIAWFFLNLGNIKTYLKLRIVQAILLFWLIGAVSLFSAYFVTHSINLNIGILHFLRRIEYMSLFILAATTLKSRKQLKVLVSTIIVTTILVVIYGFGQIYLHFPVISTTNSEFAKGQILYLTSGARVNSTFAGHYDLAAYLSIVLAILGGLFLYYKSLFKKGLTAVFGVVSFALLGLTASRISFLAILVGLTLLLWLNKQKLLLVGLVFLAIVSVGVIPELRHRLVATLTVNILNGGGPKYAPPPGTITDFTPINQIPPDQRQKVLDERASATRSGVVYKDTVAGEPVNSTELGVYRSFGIRFNTEWPRALNALYRNPLLGSGYSSITLATDNDILRSLGETGLLGTATLVLIFYILIKDMISFIKKDSDKFEKQFIIATYASIVIILITGTFIDVLEASKIAEIYWLLLGVAFAVTRGYLIKTDD